MPSKAKPRLGVFGGAFDPPHRAHMALAQAAYAQLGLSRLLLIPTGQAAHREQTLTAGEHRLAMLALALGESGADAPVDFDCAVDDREIRRPGLSLMVDTLRELQQENPSADLFLLIGADQAQNFQHWHDWTGILNLAHIAVAPRPLSEHAEQAEKSPLCRTRFDFESAPQARVFHLDFLLMPVSATQLRQQWAQSVAEWSQDSAPTSPLVSPAVTRYIAKHQLYKAP